MRDSCIGAGSDVVRPQPRWKKCRELAGKWCTLVEMREADVAGRGLLKRVRGGDCGRSAGKSWENGALWQGADRRMWPGGVSGAGAWW